MREIIDYAMYAIYLCKLVAIINGLLVNYSFIKSAKYLILAGMQRAFNDRKGIVK
jgi:hypothetical protein